MCGINAIFDPRRRLANKAGLVCSMSEQMKYRGPDDEGSFSGDIAALGMRRLSIIDVDGGRQPLYSEDRSLVLVFNGEIYNYVELAHGLKQRGHQFRTDGDAETILHLYEEKGTACLDDLRGMFAFVLWDDRRKQLFAARDRVGIKPLYFAYLDDVLWLCSELKAIVRAAGITPALRAVAVSQFLLHSYAVDQRHTIVEQVKRVLPGEYLVANSDGVSFTRYWSPKFGGDEGISDRPDGEIVEHLAEAVQLHLRSDVPVGILLSSGIDSSTVATFAARSGQNYTALCAGYVGHHTVDERSAAHATADYLGLPHRDVVLDPESYASAFDELACRTDEPVGDPAAMPQWDLYRQARESGYKVLLSGIGGDEVFFGYPAWNRSGEASRSLTAAEYKHWDGFSGDPVQKAAREFLDLLSGEPLKQTTANMAEPLFAFRDNAPQGPDGMNSILFNAYLVQNGCFLADKLGMSCSVEVRVPFLDHVLVQAVFDLPLRRRFDPAQSKVMLRRILRGLVPDVVLDAPKRGFTPPGEYLDLLVAQRLPEILDGVLVKSGWVVRPELETLCGQHTAMPWLRRARLRNMLGIPRSGWFLFRLLGLERWYSTLVSQSAPGLN